MGISGSGRFGYATERVDTMQPLTTEPGQESPVLAVQPKVPVTRGEKTIAVSQADYAIERSEVGQPAPPLPPKVQWTQTRTQAGAVLAVSRSRTDLLSEKIAKSSG